MIQGSKTSNPSFDSLCQALPTPAQRDKSISHQEGLKFCVFFSFNDSADKRKSNELMISIEIHLLIKRVPYCLTLGSG